MGSDIIRQELLIGSEISRCTRWIGALKGLHIVGHIYRMGYGAPIHGISV